MVSRRNVLKNCCKKKKKKKVRMLMSAIKSIKIAKLVSTQKEFDKERKVNLKNWTTTSGIIPLVKETKRLVRSRKGNGRLSWHDPRFLNSNFPFFLNLHPMAPLQPKKRPN